MFKLYVIKSPSTLNTTQRIALLCLLCIPAFAPGKALASTQIIVGSDFLTGIQYMVRPSIEAGGGELVSGSDTEGASSSLTGGEGGSVELGIRLNLRPFNRPSFATELTFGIKKSSLNVGSGSADFTYSTFAISQFYRFKNKVRIGAGIGVSISPELELNVPGFDDMSTSFDAAPEYRAMLEYGFKRGFAVGGRYRITDWTSNGVTVDGSSAGIYLTVQTR